jgi:hypothetical protein
LEDGGVTFVKLGQVLSTHPDLLPIEFVDELTKPQDTVPPAPREQVHRARLHSRAEVVVKVQRPGARRMTEDDLDIAVRLAGTLQARTRWGRSIGVKDLAEGFAVALREELDFRVEAVSAARSDGPVVPRVHEDLHAALPMLRRLPRRVSGSRCDGRTAARHRRRSAVGSVHRSAPGVRLQPVGDQRSARPSSRRDDLPASSVIVGSTRAA